MLMLKQQKIFPPYEIGVGVRVGRMLIKIRWETLGNKYDLFLDQSIIN